MSSSLAVSTALIAAFAVCACKNTGTATSTGAGAGMASSTTATSGSTTATAATGAGGAGGSKPSDPCGSALLCETFDNYPGVTALVDKQVLGPWTAALKTPGATMELDGTHTTSGARALHIHIDTAQTAGGRLFAQGNEPIFQGNPMHLYGRMMMYIDPNGPSIHWTFFGASGNADPTSPAAGRRATYLMSSLPKNNVNTYSFVYGLAAQGTDPYHDCYNQGPGPMATATWSCISFEMDSSARKLRMTANDTPQAPVSVAVDDHGQGCVGTVPGTSPWYGPAVDQLYVGAWSFHNMVSPLDVWIDDLVVDTKPVTCP